MNETVELETAHKFVIRRIDEEAIRSGEPLTEEQRFLLEHLPTEPVMSEACAGDPEYPPLVIPIDLDYERLCTLARAAYHQDLQLNPSNHVWLFSKAVADLHKHPVAWLLGWAGVRLRRPWWDRCLLIVTALVSIVIWMFLTFYVMDSHLWANWVVTVAGGVALITILWFGTRWLEQSQLRRAIDRYVRSNE